MEFHERKSPRINGYDYAAPNYYFITICTQNKKCIFGSAGRLNQFGLIAQKCMTQISAYYPQIKVDKYVVMPNHIHAIIVIEQSTDKKQLPDLTRIIGQYKMSVTKAIHRMNADMQVWQRSFHDHVIRNEEGYQKIWTYIENNPAKWADDCFYQTDTNE